MSGLSYTVDASAFPVVVRKGIAFSAAVNMTDSGTGTAKRTANVTPTATVASATYTQAEITALMLQIKALGETQKALKDDLISHGLIGA